MEAIYPSEKSVNFNQCCFIPEDITLDSQDCENLKFNKYNNWENTQLINLITLFNNVPSVKDTASPKMYRSKNQCP
jgi:hypothetical protein